MLPDVGSGVALEQHAVIQGSTKVALAWHWVGTGFVVLLLLAYSQFVQQRVLALARIGWGGSISA